MLAGVAGDRPKGRPLGARRGVRVPLPVGCAGDNTPPEPRRASLPFLSAPSQITRKKITDTRSRMQGYDDVAAARRREKDLKAAEYRLQHEKQRLSSQAATNRQLKGEVESLRRDRMQRLGIIDKLDAQVEAARVRPPLAALVGHAGALRDATCVSHIVSPACSCRVQSEVEGVSLELRSEAEARDAAQRDIQAMQRALKEEVGDFERRFEERIAKAAEEVSAPNRLEQMERHAVQSESEALLLHLGSAEGHHGTLSIMQERSLKHKSTRVRDAAAPKRAQVAQRPAAQAPPQRPAAQAPPQRPAAQAPPHPRPQTLWEVAKREVEVAEQREALVEFEDAFAAIKEGTSIRTIDEMVSAFSEAEDASYSLVTMINEVRARSPRRRPRAPAYARWLAAAGSGPRRRAWLLPGRAARQAAPPHASPPPRPLGRRRGTASWRRRRWRSATCGGAHGR